MATKLLNLKNPIIVFLLLIAFPFISYSQQIGVGHLFTIPANTISDNSGNSPSAANNTLFGSATSRTFYIDNIQ